MKVEEIEFLSPVHYFEALKNDPHCFLLESAGRGEIARYSFLSSDPFLIFKSKGEEIEIRKGDEKESIKGNPFDVLKELLSGYSFSSSSAYPPFLGGAVGYFGYDLCHFVEQLPRRSRDDLLLPDCYIGFYNWVIAVDHYLEKAWIFSPDIERDKGRQSRKRVGRIKERLKRAEKSRMEEKIFTFSSRITSNFTRTEYLKAVEKAKEYIRAGDIFQVNLSQRLTTSLPSSPFELYQALIKINPAPFSGILKFPELTVLSVSPERFLRISGRKVQTRPIKGTRPRGRTPEEDRKLARELQYSEKDNAELLMIVDLERNDLGRVCEYGSVKVPRLVTLETHPTVFHLVGTIAGVLKEGVSHLDCLKACFPGGSITGAPKVRAMEIIDELEPTQRSIYTGSIGYIGFNGETDMDIVIRTMIVKNKEIYFQVGGGIVADSEPELEYEETIHKAKALIETLRMDCSRTFK